MEFPERIKRKMCPPTGNVANEALLFDAVHKGICGAI